jgi:hypothetical protein
MHRSLPFIQSEHFTQWVGECLESAASNLDALPSDNPFALQPDTLALLREILRRERPARVVEFGGGRSTAVFAEWRAATESFSCLTLEHDGGWARQLSTDYPSARVLHAPLRPLRAGARLFLTYKGLTELNAELRGAQLFLVDGPHGAGREAVLFAALSACEPGALVMIDDLRLSFVQDMLATVPQVTARCFAGVALEDNSHGLYLLRCIERPTSSSPPWVGARAAGRSVWRCLRDTYIYGTGD